MDPKAVGWSGVIARCCLWAVVAPAIGLSLAACGPQQGNSDEPIARAFAKLNVTNGSWGPVGPLVMQSNFSYTVLYESGGVPTFSGNVSGAANMVVPDPMNAGTLYVATVNGGIWRTTNADDIYPNWVPLTDYKPSLSAGVLAMDPDNSSVLLAGTGAYSNFLGNSHPYFGRLYLTSNGGNDWTTIEDPSLVGQVLTSVHIRGNRMIVSTYAGAYRSVSGAAFSAMNTGLSATGIGTMVEDPSNKDRYYAGMAGVGGGVFRWDDGGSGSWVAASSGALQSTLTAAAAEGIELAVGVDGRIYAAVQSVGEVSWVGYSTDLGVNWTAMDVPRYPFASSPGVALPPGSVQNVSGAAGSAIVVTTTAAHNLGLVNDPSTRRNRLRVRIAGVTGNPAANGDWLPEPVVDSMNNVIGNQFSLLNPITLSPALSNGTTATGGTWTPWIAMHPGHQTWNLAIAVDPTDSKYVYLAGDGYNGYLGGLTGVVRGDATATANNGLPSAQWSSLVGPQGTKYGTYPHADARWMAFDAAGRLLETCDGGLFRHATPRATDGDWHTMNSSLGTAEIHDLAVDGRSGMAFGGAQDNGTVSRSLAQVWDAIEGGDGGDVQVDYRPAASTESDRYVSSQSFGCFNRKGFDASGAPTGTVEVPQLCIGGPCSKRCPDEIPKVGTDLYDADPRTFVTRFALNEAAAPAAGGDIRIAIAGQNNLFESLDDGATVASVGVFSVLQNPTYGHPTQAGALWATTSFDGTIAGSSSQVVRRLGDTDILAPTPTPIPVGPGSFSGEVVLAPSDPNKAYVVSSNRVYFTPDAGTTWNDISGDLFASVCGGPVTQRALTFHAVEYVPSPNGDRVYVAADNGVFMASVANPTVWVQPGGNLPHAVAWDLDYDADGGRDTLSVATLGRGVWALPQASLISQPPIAACKPVTKSVGATCKATVAPNEFDNGTTDPEGDPLTFYQTSQTVPVTPASVEFGPGMQCIQLQANDGHGAIATCETTLTVTDATPPTLTTPAPITRTLCDTNGEAITLTPPVASDNCPTTPVTGTVIASTDPTLVLPMPVPTSNVITLSAGVHTIRWSVSDNSNPATTVDQVITLGPAFYATQSFDLKDRARVQLPNGTTYATAINSGTGQTHIGFDARIGDILSAGPVVVNDRATVQGFIRSRSSIALGSQLNFIGPAVDHTTVNFPPTRTATTSFTTATTNVNLQPSQQRTVAPGRYNRWSLVQNSRIFLSAGEYWVNNLSLQSGSFVSVSQSGGTVRINVRDTMTMRGDFTVTPSPVGFLLAYFGNQFTLLERPWAGTLIAANASIALGGTTFQTFSGQFFTKTFEVRPDVTVICREDF